jgi:hypothetical protein
VATLTADVDEVQALTAELAAMRAERDQLRAVVLDLINPTTEVELRRQLCAELYCDAVLAADAAGYERGARVMERSWPDIARQFRDPSPRYPNLMCNCAAPFPLGQFGECSRCGAQAPGRADELERRRQSQIGRPDIRGLNHA